METVPTVTKIDLEYDFLRGLQSGGPRQERFQCLLKTKSLRDVVKIENNSLQKFKSIRAFAARAIFLKPIKQLCQL